MKKERVFLATTALEEFWDTKKPVVFLGDWCLRPSRKDFWQKLNGNIIEGIWREKQNFIASYDYVNRLYERLLFNLAISMNEVHGEEHGMRYWRIIIGPWLFHYLSVLYDRYLYIDKATSEYPEFETILLSEKSFVIPENTVDFIQLVADDPYNLQIFSKILLTKVDRDFEAKEFPIRHIESRTNKRNYSCFKSLNKKKIINTLLSVGSSKNNIFMFSPYLTKYVIFRIALKSRGKILPIFPEDTIMRTTQIDIGKRELLGTLSFEEQCEFEKLVLSFLPSDIPLCFIENYKALKEEALKEYTLNPKAILSWIGWYFHEKFKIWAAHMSERGVKLIGAQHGGNYGLDRYMWAMEHEIEINDKFYTWGWHYEEFGDKVKPLPASILVGKKSRNKSSLNKEHILYARIAWPRFLYRMQYPTNNHLEAYHEYMITFIRRLDTRIRAVLKLRLFFQDYGGDVLKRLHDAKINIQLDNLSIPFQSSIDSCRLFVCDQISTTYAEALAKNIPTIIFFDPDMYIHRIKAESCFDDLQRVGIMHYSPESAAKKVNELYDIVDEWWNDGETQWARSKFCSLYARSSSDGINEWVNELMNLSNAGE